MADVGLLFTKEMVLRLLAGEKTQTRRTALPRSNAVPGARLWARETWYCDHVGWHADPREGTVEEWLPLTVYRADGPPLIFEGEQPRWTPSIHMPKWACRIWREIVDVRREVLLAITDADAVAEGAQHLPGEPWSFSIADQKLFGSTPATAYLRAWDHLNGSVPEMSSEFNPEVTVYTFKEIAK